MIYIRTTLVNKDRARKVSLLTSAVLIQAFKNWNMY